MTYTVGVCEVAVRGEEGCTGGWDMLILPESQRPVVPRFLCELAATQGSPVLRCLEGGHSSNPSSHTGLSFSPLQPETVKPTPLANTDPARLSWGHRARAVGGEIRRCVQNRMCAETKINHLTRLQPGIVLITSPNLSVLETHTAQLGRRHEIILQTSLISTFPRRRSQASQLTR